jgi:hypothetical protein
MLTNSLNVLSDAYVEKLTFETECRYTGGVRVTVTAPK